MIRRIILVVFFALVCVVDVLSQRIVSLAPSVTQTLVQIGVGDRVVGRTSYCPQLEHAVVVGDAISFNVEAIYALQPDIVIAMSFAPPETVAKLVSLGVNVQSFVSPSSFEEICSQTIQIGKLVNAFDAASSLVVKEREKVRLLQTNKKRGKMFFQIGTKPVWGVSPSLYMNDLITMSGYENILTEGNGLSSREFVAASNPDVIVMTTMGGMASDEQRLWQSLVSSRVIIVDDNVASCPTPTNFRLTLEDILRQL